MMSDEYEVEIQAWLTPDTALRNSRRRVNRAAQHLRELAELFHKFRAANAGKVFVVIEATQVREGRSELPVDYEATEFTVDWSGSTVPSFKIGVLAGEVVYNLRAALDYLVYALAELDSGTINEKTQFPIEERPEVFWGQRRNTWLGGVSDDHVAQLALYQPFSGCTWTGILRDLSNVDKHRQLTPLNPSWCGRLPPDGSMFEVIAADPEHARAPLLDQEPRVLLAEKYPVVETLDELGHGVRACIKEFEGDFSGPEDGEADG